MNKEIKVNNCECNPESGTDLNPAAAATRITKNMISFFFSSLKRQDQWTGLLDRQKKMQMFAPPGLSGNLFRFKCPLAETNMNLVPPLPHIKLEVQGDVDALDELPDKGNRTRLESFTYMAILLQCD